MKDLKLHVDEIHVEYYDIDETNLFFRTIEEHIVGDIKGNKDNWISEGGVQNPDACITALVCMVRKHFTEVR